MLHPAIVRNEAFCDRPFEPWVAADRARTAARRVDEYDVSLPLKVLRQNFSKRNRLYVIRSGALRPAGKFTQPVRIGIDRYDLAFIAHERRHMQRFTAGSRTRIDNGHPGCRIRNNRNELAP